MLGKFWKHLFGDKNDKICADIFISLSADSADGSRVGGCPIAYFLSKYRLRSFSLPFDWMMNCKLKDITHLIQSEGREFFTQIEQICVNKETREIRDKQTGIIAIHDFPISQSVEEYYPLFVEKYKRRFKRLIKTIQKNKKIAFLSRRDTSIKEFECFLQEMQKFHKAKYTFINIRHDENITNLQKTIKMIDYYGGGGIIIEYIFNNTHKNGSDGVSNPDAWLGNVEIWDEIMKELKFTHKKAFVIFLERKREKIKRFYKKYIIKNAKY